MAANNAVSRLIEPGRLWVSKPILPERHGTVIMQTFSKKRRRRVTVFVRHENGKEYSSCSRRSALRLLPHNSTVSNLRKTKKKQWDRIDEYRRDEAINAKTFIHENGPRCTREPMTKKFDALDAHASTNIPATSTSTHKSRKRLTCRG